MSQLSPTATLLWAVLSVVQLCFLLYHLYRFDKFQCLKWTTSRQQGAFKRMLTYAYVLSVPLMLVFSVGLAYLKYSRGYVQMQDGSILPVPTVFWDQHAKSLGRALYIILGVTWSLEMVSHLEELNFWLFLLTTSAETQPWLHSPYFLTWCLGSVIALLGMPLVAVFAPDLDRAEAYVFISGSIGSGVITVASLRVIFLFPTFLKQVQVEGAEMDVMCRLAKYNELNNIRVFFRCMFVGCAMAMGVEGLKTLDEIVPMKFWTDMLAIMSAVGVAISSAITLVVFFPRASPAASLQSRVGTAHQEYYTHHSSPTRRAWRCQPTSYSRRDHPDPFRASAAHINYPPAVFPRGYTNGLGLEIDPTQSWISQKNFSASTFEYEVTVERYDDSGNPVGFEDDSKHGRIQMQLPSLRRDSESTVGRAC